MINYCSIDGGNSTINLVINGKTFKRSFPSIQSDAIAAKQTYVNNAVWSKDVTTQLWNKLHVDTTLGLDTPKEAYKSEFLFGLMAEEYRKDLRSRANKEKYQDKDLAKLMVTALAYGLLETKMEEETFTIKQDMNIQFTVVLATGLPYREGRYPEKRDIWAGMFRGTHRVNFKHPIFKNLTIDLVVDEIYTFIEGEMPLNLELRKPGGFLETTTAQDLYGKSMSIIDMGGHTTEVVTIAYEMVHDDDNYNEYDETELNVQQVTKLDLTFGLQRGVATIMDEIVTEVEEQYRAKGIALRPLTRRDVELAFTVRGQVDGKRGYILPEKIFVGDMFKLQAQNLVNSITDTTQNMFASIISSLDTVYLCGGGSKIDIIVNSIKEKLSAEGFDPNRIITINKPDLANVRGYYYALNQRFPENSQPLSLKE